MYFLNLMDIYYKKLIRSFQNMCQQYVRIPRFNKQTGTFSVVYVWKLLPIICNSWWMHVLPRILKRTWWAVGKSSALILCDEFKALVFYNNCSWDMCNSRWRWYKMFSDIKCFSNKKKRLSIMFLLYLKIHKLFFVLPQWKQIHKQKII